MKDFENELFNAADTRTRSKHETLVSGCRKLGLLRENEQFIDLLECTPWHRGGAETYVSTAVIYLKTKSGNDARRKVIAKAYAGFGLGISPDKRVKTWQERAACLSDMGVPTAKIYGSHKGVLFAEYIKHSLINFLNARNDIYTAEWSGRLLSEIATGLDSLKVQPVYLLADLRTDVQQIYLTDYGEDLGKVPGTASDPHYCRNLIKKELVKHGLDTVERYFTRTLTI